MLYKVLGKYRNPSMMLRNFSSNKKSSTVQHSSGALKAPLTWLSLGLIAFSATGILYYYERRKKEALENISKEVAVSGKPDLGGPFTLINQFGESVTDASYHGKYLILYFGFAHCPDICPSELVKIGKIKDEIDKLNLKTQLKPVFISVDPSRDTVGLLRNYSQDFHNQIDYLTGTNEQVSKVTRAYRVYFSKVDEDEDGDYLVDHSIVLYLISPDGEFLDFFTQKMQVIDIVNKIKSHMRTK